MYDNITRNFYGETLKNKDMANLITARELYEILIFDYKIKSLGGFIRFKLGDIDIAVKRRDIIGDVIQSWVAEWLERSRFDFIANPLPHRPPDIYLNKKNLRQNWLEIKAFNRADNPRFSIGVFEFFARDLIERPWHLDADYLIFGYVVNEETGMLKISDLWLKKIWEITKAMSTWPLTVQLRNGVINEIRPCNWYSTRTRTKVFECLEDFLSAFRESLYRNSKTRFYAPRWEKKFKKAYKEHYGREIFIPRWQEIKNKYRIIESEITY